MTVPIGAPTPIPILVPKPGPDGSKLGLACGIIVRTGAEASVLGAVPAAVDPGLGSVELDKGRVVGVGVIVDVTAFAVNAGQW